MAPQAPPSTAVPEGVPSTFAVRRRLLRGGLGAAPVLMSVVSRPVSAGECMSCSAFCSISTSRGPTASTCMGKLPDFWMQEATFTQWPPGFVPVATDGSPATTFNAVFPGHRQQGVGYPGLTLLDVLRKNVTMGRDGAARHLAAAVLNANAGLVPQEVLDANHAKYIWTPIDRGHPYEPTAGIKMYPDYCVPASPTGGGLIYWLRTTMI